MEACFKLDIKQLKYFLQICENFNFSETAKNLYITQQGLSKSIKNLEDELKLALFYREGNKIRLTKYGLFLKEKSINIVNQFESLEDSLQKLAQKNNGTVRIGYSLSLIKIFNYIFISDFKKVYPNIQLHFSEYTDLQCEQAIISEEIDIGFTIGPIETSKFDFKLLLSKKVCMIINNENFFAKNNDITLSEIKHNKIVTLNYNFKIYNNFISRCKKIGFEPNIFFTTSNSDLVHCLSHLNGVIGIDVYYKDMPGLHFIPFRDPYFNWEICLITKKGSHLSDNVRIFINYIIKNINKYI